MRIKSFCLTLAILLIGMTGLAQDIPARPVPPRLVNDFANLMSDKQVATLENKLERYNDTTGTQICVVTVKSLNGTTSDDFAQKLGEKWGVGHKENNGVVILVKPKTSDELGDVSIQVGYGMEPYITDAANYVIRTKEMIPAFKQNDYYTGINNAVDAIIGLASGAFSAEHYADEEDENGSYAMLAIMLFVAYIILQSIAKSRVRNGKSANDGFWKGLFWGIFLSGLGRGSGGSHSSSGGFGGFGGGHFGGGGGSSKW